MSNSSHTLTFEGSAVLDGDIRKFGFTSAYFDGADERISVADSTDFELGSGAFTIECWVRYATDPSTETFSSGMVSKYASATADRGFSMDYKNDDHFRFLWSTDGGAPTSHEAVWVPVADTWYHAAVSRSGDVLYMFIDGELLASPAITGSLYDMGEPVSIGSIDGTGGTMDGWIENVRITKGVARYTATFTPPERAYPTVAAIPEPSIEQTLTFNAAYSHPSITISNGDRTMTQTTPAGSWMWGNGPQTDEKLRASGGKWMYEVVIDSMPSTSAFVGVGWGNGNKSGLSTVYAGNTNGGAQLIDDENGTLCRMYKGAPANSFVTATTSRYPLDAGGTIITFGLDLDNDTCSCYMDGLAMIEDQAFALNGSEDDSVLWYVKSFQGAVITLPTTITYPIEGYTVWK